MSEQQAMTEITKDKVILWQDHAHSQGYRPTLTLLEFPDGRMALELNVHGKVFVIPYVKPECPRCT